MEMRSKRYRIKRAIQKLCIDATVPYQDKTVLMDNRVKRILKNKHPELEERSLEWMLRWKSYSAALYSPRAEDGHFEAKPEEDESSNR